MPSIGQAPLIQASSYNQTSAIKEALTPRKTKLLQLKTLEFQKLLLLPISQCKETVVKTAMLSWESKVMPF